MMKRSLVSCVLGIAVLAGSASLVTLPGCATVAGDPVGTNAARYVQTGNVYRAALRGWAATLEADTHRVTPLISNEKRNEIKRVRLEIDVLFDQWSQSVASGQPFNGIDSLFSLLDALARATTEVPQ